MEIAQVIELKDRLADKIEQLIIEFEKETSVQIVDINIAREYVRIEGQKRGKWNFKEVQVKAEV